MARFSESLQECEEETWAAQTGDKETLFGGMLIFSVSQKIKVC